MTQEQKAKAYDEALKQIKECTPDENGFVTIYPNEIFPELAESEDEKIRKAIIDIVKKDEERIGVNAHLKKLQWLERQGEQKPVDKAEPKFKVGEYIKHNKANIICKVISVNSGSYHVENIETSGRIELFNAEQNFHLWTIQDAKDGNVLAEDSCIFIVQKLSDNNTIANTYCALHNDGDFEDGSILYFDTDSTKPATKEQRELLFQKMKEAGYEWDAEKKELKKIKQKPSEWSEEDSKRLQRITDFLWYNRKGDTDTIYQQEQDIEWLKSLRPQKH